MANDFFSDVKKVQLNENKKKDSSKKSANKKSDTDKNTSKLVEKFIDSSSDKIENIEIPIDNIVGYVDSDGTKNDDIFGPITDESLSSLVSGIKEFGFRTAIEVWKLENGKYMVYSGHRRLKAMQLLGYKTIKCDIYDYPEKETERRLLFLRANILTRGSINAASEGGSIYITRQIEYLENILRKEGIKKNEIADAVMEEFNCKRVTIWKYKALANACDELIEAESKGYILLNQASSLSVFNKDDQKVIVRAIVQSSDSGKPLTGKDINQLIKKLHYSQEVIDFQGEHSVENETASIISAIVGEKASKESPLADDKQVKADNNSTYEKYSKKFSCVLKELEHNKADNLEAEYITKLIDQSKDVEKALMNTLVFVNLMNGKYKNSKVNEKTIIDPDDISSFNYNQIYKLQNKYKNYPKIVSQFDTSGK